MSYGSGLFAAYYNALHASQPLPTAGLVYYHPLNEALATLPTGQSLTTSGTWTYGTVNGVPCATKANGTAYMLLDDDSTIPVGHASRTMSAWIAVLNTNTTDIFGYGANNTATVAWNYRTGSGNVYFPPRGSNETAVATDTWHHLLTTFDDATSTVTWYMDGVAVGNTVSSGLNTSAISSSYPVFIGYNQWQYGFRIAGARIYNRVLTQAEITALAHEFTPTA